MTCLSADYMLEIGRLVLVLQPEELGPDDEVIPPDDPYFRPKKRRPRAVVEAWKGKVPM